MVEGVMIASPEDVVAGGEILAVDDTADSLDYLRELLHGQGYSVRTAQDGEAALRAVQERVPELVLLDVRMPGLDGHEVCRRLKADVRTCAVPVIFLSALTEPEDKVQGFRAGGADYLGKPFDADELLQRVATHLRLARVTRALEEERACLAGRVRERTAELECTAQALRHEVAQHVVLNERLRLLARTFEASFSGMMITDPDAVIVAVNPAFTALTGYSGDECIGRPASLLRSDRHDADFFVRLRQMLLDTGHWSGELWVRRKDGNVFPCLHSIFTVRDEGGLLTHFVATFHDISEIRDAQTLIDFLVHHDPLTGLPNRIIAQDRFERLAAGLPADEALAVVCINIDRFRQINDLHGYAFGNEILQWVAQQLREVLPESDTLFRENSDEFVLIHRGGKVLHDTRAMCAQIHRRLNAQVALDGRQIAVAVSLGVAVFPFDGSTFGELVANASLALSRIKQEGGAGQAFFSESIDHGRRVRYDMAQNLQDALMRGEFEVFFQPQIDTDSTSIIGAEALLRWHSPRLGQVSPAAFIPVAEETGAIIALGEWVLQTVCRQIARWRDAGLGEVKVAVNLSARQFAQTDIRTMVSRAIDANAIPGTCLEFEITEGAVIGDVHQAIATLHALKELGVSLALDDFGTGYSSLSYLKRLPIDFLKIDQSFVRDLIVDEDANAIVQSIVSLAHHMRLQVIAEGVETTAQRDHLAAQGCDFMQGYLFGKPVPAADFHALLVAQAGGGAT